MKTEFDLIVYRHASFMWHLFILFSILACSVHASTSTLVIDTGNGLATVTRFPNGEIMVYDTGHWTQDIPVAEAIENFMGEQTTISLLVASHSDSDLATENALDNLFRVFTKMGSLLGTPTLQSIVVAKAIKLILSGLQKLPGTESVNPNAKYIRALSKSQSTLANEYMYFRANFNPENKAIAFIDQQIVDKAIFSSKANDIVVPFEGAGVSKRYLDNKVKKTLVKQYGTKNRPAHEIWHINFFGNQTMRKSLVKTLCTHS